MLQSSQAFQRQLILLWMELSKKPSMIILQGKPIQTCVLSALLTQWERKVGRLLKVKNLWGDSCKGCLSEERNPLRGKSSTFLLLWRVEIHGEWNYLGGRFQTCIGHQAVLVEENIFTKKYLYDNINIAERVILGFTWGWRMQRWLQGM